MTDSHFSPELTEPESEEESYAMQNFCMVYTDELAKFICYFQEKKIRTRDAAIMLALLCFHNPKTGLCHVSVSHLAQIIGANLSDISSGVTRLKKSLLVATYVDKVSGQRSFLVNPYIFISGGKSKRAMLRKRFKELINGLA